MLISQLREGRIYKSTVIFHKGLMRSNFHDEVVVVRNMSDTSDGVDITFINGDLKGSIFHIRNENYYLLNKEGILI